MVPGQGWRSGPGSEREPCLWVVGDLVLPPRDAQSHFLNEAWPGPLTWVAPAIFDINDALPQAVGKWAILPWVYRSLTTGG